MIGEDWPSSSQVAPSQGVRLLPDTVPELLFRLGQELSCPVCRDLLAAPVLTPCLHAYCRDCMAAFFRARRHSDDNCPCCHSKFNKRALKPAPLLECLVASFRELTTQFEDETGNKWDAPDAGIEAAAKQRGHYSSLPTSQEVERLRRVDEQLAAELAALDRLIAQQHCPPTAPTETTDLGQPLPSEEDLFRATDNQERSGPILITSRIRKEDLNSVAEFAETFDTPIVSQFVEGVTHVVASEEGRIAKRTLKLLRGMLAGCWIVSSRWLDACRQAGRIVNEEPFEILGDETCPDEAGPSRARASRTNGEPPLLSGYHFYLYGLFVAPPLEELVALIAEAGGRVIGDVSDVMGYKNVVVLCDPRAQTDFERDAGILRTHLPFLATSWLLDCISAYQIVEIRPHIVLDKLS